MALRWAPVAIALLLPRPAGAHPFAVRVTAHQSTILVTPEVIRVDYTVETPAAAPPGPPGAPASGTPDLQTLDEVASGLLLTVDGEVVPLLPDPEHPPRVRRTSQTIAMRIGLLAPAPSGRRATVTLSNANYPDLPGFFTNTVEVDASIQVLASSLFVPDARGRLQDKDGAWVPGDAGREVTVELAFRRGALQQAYQRLAGIEGQRRSAWEARSATPWSAWFRGGSQPAFVVLAAALAMLLGLGRTVAHRGHAAGTVAAAALPALLLAVLPSTALAWIDVGAGVTAAALGIWSLRGGPSGAAVLGGIGALALTLHHAGFAALLAVCAAIGMGLGRVLDGTRPDERPPAEGGLAVLVLVVGALVAARGLGALLGSG